MVEFIYFVYLIIFVFIFAVNVLLFFSRICFNRGRTEDYPFGRVQDKFLPNLKGNRIVFFIN